LNLPYKFLNVQLCAIIKYCIYNNLYIWKTYKFRTAGIRTNANLYQLYKFFLHY